MPVGSLCPPHPLCYFPRGPERFSGSLGCLWGELWKLEDATVEMLQEGRAIVSIG